MEARDILRIALFVVVALFAIYQVLFLKVRSPAEITNEDESKDTTQQKLIQQSKQIKSNTITEQMEYGNKMTENI